MQEAPLPEVHRFRRCGNIGQSYFNAVFRTFRNATPSDSVLALLSAAAKYVMDGVQFSIRVVINRRESFSSTPAELFRIYAVTCSKGLIPEMQSLARLTLCHLVTSESLSDALQSFEGRALRYLADFHLRTLRGFASK